jgi:hypothetical protein
LSKHTTKPATKINQLLADCPAGVPMTSPWLESKGVSPQLVQKYKESGWLEPLGRGGWIRAGTKPTLTGSIYALQKLPINLYPAARTALELSGRAHYLPIGQYPVVHLGLDASHRLPDWFKRLEFVRHLHTLNASALFYPLFASLVDYESNGMVIKISSPERAMLEYCQLLPKYADFEEAWQLMEGLPTLLPRRMQSTLQACKSVKAKRLFLALATAVNHEWLDELEIPAIDLGSGNRILPIAGAPHPEFGITVPETWIVK